MPEHPDESLALGMTAAPRRLILGLLVAIAFWLPSSAPAARHVPQPCPEVLSGAAQAVRSDPAELHLAIIWFTRESDLVLVATAYAYDAADRPISVTNEFIREGSHLNIQHLRHGSFGRGRISTFNI